MADTNELVTTDLPAWYQDYTKNLGSQAAQLAARNNQSAVHQEMAGFNGDQLNAFQQVRNTQGQWQPYFQQGQALNNQLAGTTSSLVDYAQRAVGTAPMNTGASVQPWAADGMNATAGTAQSWTDPGTVNQYMSPYTSQVVDNIGRLGQQNWENNIMPGINSSMIGSGQFGSTRNADILSRAGVNAANDITGQQSNALQAGYTGGAGIFANDANRQQQQQQMRSGASLAGGNLMQNALNSDANRIQNQQQLQANTALTGANNAANGLNIAATNAGALAKNYQQLTGYDAQSLLNVGDQQQKQTQGALTMNYENLQNMRNDPWNQLKNSAGILNGIQLPKTVTSTGSTGVV